MYAYMDVCIVRVYYYFDEKLKKPYYARIILNSFS